ncbi:MAG: CocE/NonD family hydrolase, partial [SAR202 cluster bacterium]|nr:CocE/NonD family hydrolase [SAR202 cluster bacterium]
MPREFSVVVEKNREIRLRDGTPTYADIFRPQRDGKVPVVVVRTPYDKEASMGTLSVLPPYLKLAERGYAVVLQDCRGRFSSAGQFYPYADEANDGHDTVAWAARQPWSNGSVALMGASYFGATTMLGARGNPPGLKAIVPIITTDEYYETWSYHGGAFQLGFLGTWGAGLAAAQFLRPDSQVPADKRQKLLEAVQDAKETLSHRPISSLPGVSDPQTTPWWRDWVSHTENDDYWRRWRVADSHSTMTAAGLHIGGWYDIFFAGTVRNFVGLTRAGKAPQRLIVGPWAHTGYDRWLGVQDFGAAAPANLAGVPLEVYAWLDRHLAGKQEVNTGAPVKYFMMGANRWMDAAAWPIPGAQAQRWFLRSRGSANSLRGDGVLSRETPSSDEPDDVFIYNPDRPVPTSGGSLLMVAVHQAGPHDQRSVE